MRDIRALPIAPGDDAEGPTTNSSWSQTQGLLFIGGLVIVVACLSGLGYCGYNYLRLDLSYDPRAHVEQQTSSVESTPLAELHDEWKNARDRGLIPVATPQHIRNLRSASLLTRGMVGTGLGALAGLTCIIIACRLPPQPTTDSRA